MTSSDPPHRGAPAPMRPVALELRLRLVINTAVPVLVYALLRRHVHSDVTALVIGAAIPVAYTAGFLLRRHRLDPVGVIAVAGFALGLLLLAATGGNELAFKLREDIWTGPVGLACLISAAVGRPLFFAVLQLAARRNAEIAERIRDPAVRRISAVTTVVVGAILLVHALVIVTLALTTDTATFLALSRPVSWLIVGGGLAGLVWWIRRQRPARS